MRICIISPPKCGSTGLYNLIKNSFGDREILSLFEPSKSIELFGFCKLKSEHKLTKIMITKLDHLDLKVKYFDKYVYLIRDPRDFLVSAMFFRFNELEIASSKIILENFENCLIKKNSNNNIVTLTELFSILKLNISNSIKQYRKMIERILELQKKTNGFLLRYEDFCESNFDSLTKYLGIQLNKNSKLHSWTSKIYRTGNHGDWVNWFTEQDFVNHSSELNHILKITDYLPKWQNLKISNKNIQLDKNLEYIKKLIDHFSVSPMLKNDFSNKNYIANLISASDDLKNIPMMKLFKYYSSNNLVNPSILNNLLFKTAMLGNINAIKLILINKYDQFDIEKKKDLRTLVRYSAQKNNQDFIKCMLLICKLEGDKKNLDKWKNKSSI